MLLQFTKPESRDSFSSHDAYFIFQGA